MAKPFLDRFSIENQILAAIKDLRSAKRDHQIACLELAQAASPDRQRAVDELEAEIERHERAIERLEAAKRAQADAAVQANSAEKAARLDALQTQRTAAVARAKRVSVELVDQLAAIGPRWLEAVNALSAASSVTREIARLHGNSTVQQVFGHGADADGHQALASAVGSAIAATGLGTTGPSLLPVLAVSAPLKPFTASDLERALDKLFDRQSDALARAAHSPAQTTTTIGDEE